MNQGLGGPQCCKNTKGSWDRNFENHVLRFVIPMLSHNRLSSYARPHFCGYLEHNFISESKNLYFTCFCPLCFSIIFSSVNEHQNMSLHFTLKSVNGGIKLGLGFRLGLWGLRVSSLVVQLFKHVHPCPQNTKTDKMLKKTWSFYLARSCF